MLNFLEDLQGLSFGLQKSLIKAHLRKNLPWPIQTKLKKPIFVVGSSRSGTTMLAAILESLPEIVDFSETVIVRHKMWRMVKSPETIPRELPDLERTLVRLSGVTKGQRLLEKTPGHSLITNYLLDYFSNASLLHIVRDGRDVALSMLGHKWISRELKEEVEVFWFHLLPQTYQEQWQDLGSWERGVLRWAVYVTSARKAQVYSERYLEVNYEEICQNPQVTISQIIDFLGLSTSPELEDKLKSIKSSSVANWQNKGLTQQQQEFYAQVVTNFNLYLSLDAFTLDQVKPILNGFWQSNQKVKCAIA